MEAGMRGMKEGDTARKVAKKLSSVLGPCISVFSFLSQPTLI